MSINAIATFSIVLTAALASVSDSAGLPPRNNLIFLGSFSPKSDNRQGIQQTSFYFLSQNAAGWSTATSDCKAFLGDTATLLNIETDEELAEVIRILQNSDDTGSTYWTGGSYFDSDTFVWSTGLKIPSSFPWDQGHPNTRTLVTRVLAYTVGGLKLRTAFSTNSLRFICELPSELPTTPGPGPTTTTSTPEPSSTTAEAEPTATT